MIVCNSVEEALKLACMACTYDVSYTFDNIKNLYKFKTFHLADQDRDISRYFVEDQGDGFLVHNGDVNIKIYYLPDIPDKYLIHPEVEIDAEVGVYDVQTVFEGVDVKFIHVLNINDVQGIGCVGGDKVYGYDDKCDSYLRIVSSFGTKDIPVKSLAYIKLTQGSYKNLGGVHEES